MQGRRIVAGIIATVAAGGLVGFAGPTAQAAPVPQATSKSTINPGVTVRALMSAHGFQSLIDSITRQVHAEHPYATFRDATGTSPSGATTSIIDVVRWDFLYNDMIGESDHIIVKASIYLPNTSALINVQHHAGVYSKELVGPVAMSPFQATLWRRLAGYPAPFTKVVYAQPNFIGSPRRFPNPVFLFYEGSDTPSQTVDTVTRSVEPWGA